MEVAEQRTVLQGMYLSPRNFNSENIHLGDNMYQLFFMDLVTGIAKQK